MNINSLCALTAYYITLRFIKCELVNCMCYNDIRFKVHNKTMVYKPPEAAKFVLPSAV